MSVRVALPALPSDRALAPKQAADLERRVATAVTSLDNIDDAIEWLAQAEALHAYLRDKDARGPMQGAMRRIEARIGELLGETKGGGPQPKTSPAREVLIDKSQKTQFRKLAKAVQVGALVYDDDTEDSPWRTSRRGLLDSVKDKIRGASRKKRETQRRTETEAKEEAARDEIAASEEKPYELHVGSLETWRPDGHSIITDPPYVGDSLPLYEMLRDFAIDVLPDGGPLVVMTWQAILPEVMLIFHCPELAYRWTICWRYANTENTIDQKRRVFDCWKPVLVYHKGAMPEDAPVFRDEIANAVTDKDFHQWGQSVEGFERLVKAFSQPGEIVCDPFLGGGTTAVAALANTRRFAGCDIDEGAVETTRKRLEN